MSNLGMGVMINMLGENNGAEHLEAAIGKTIVSMSIADEKLTIGFYGGFYISVSKVEKDS